MRDLELLFENVEATGSQGIYRHYPSSLSLHSERTCMPTTLRGEIPDVSANIPKMGATVRLRVDGQLVFIGRLFSTEIDRWGVLSFTAYDSLRYLKNTFSNYYEGSYSVQQVIRDIAKQNHLKVGKLADVPAVGRHLKIDNESGFDAISRVVDTSIVLNQRILVFYDNAGELTLSWADEMIGDVVIGDDSLATDYKLTTDIDEDTYNVISYYHESSAAGGRAFVDADDKDNEVKWGTLRLCESIDDILSEAQMQDRANKMLEMKNRPSKKMSITALGVVGLRAGMMINIHFPSVPDEISKRQMVILDSVEHNFEDSTHTMQLEVRTFWRDV
jgi:hypothetical protein